MGIEEMAKELEKLNQGISFIAFVEAEQIGNLDAEKIVILAACTDVNGINLPSGYYYSNKENLSNKCSTIYSENESFQIMSVFDYIGSMV